ncbi:hypothetical protein BWQ96_02750 [Gracilariopsis chorda]|uniref:Uncharacterized protein n=1 Tax=Gracilariopsis chorda TaxID=448386 RepID=A0A2V3IZ96_9FLOR|nr:hypothetical protein BWQ96_02750 [Gracilariopsis chorda]|eukprot:PXF47419.1 hypothetical protein BWQ96_02750 [Gracilariopsis chorda]
MELLHLLSPCHSAAAAYPPSPPHLAVELASAPAPAPAPVEHSSPQPLTPPPTPPSPISVQSPPSSYDDRDVRLETAVHLVTNQKYSVRKAAHALSLPKSTVHRYLQATRGIVKRKRSSSPPAKCAIAFLVAGMK